MIKGIDSKVYSTLVKSVDAGIGAGAPTLSKNRKKALIADIKLLTHHQKLGHMTDIELARSKRTVAQLEKEHDGMNETRRFNLKKGYLSIAEQSLL